MNTSADWRHLEEDYDRRADALRAKTDILETEIAATLRNAGLSEGTLQRVASLVSQHGLTARDWGACRARADDLAVRYLDAKAQEDSHTHIDRHLHIEVAA
jgi:hypothetical protein